MNDRAWTTAGLDAAAVEALSSKLPASEVWSLLLDVMERRANARTPADLMRQWERDRFVPPAYVDQRTLVAVDGHLLAAAHRFEAIELSPLAPLGVCSAVGRASQNKVVAAIRGTEVVSDPTNVLALESARRLREDPSQTVRLATSHRCVRAQAIPKRPGFAAHFRIFCLTTAARERQDHAFVVEALAEHIATHLAALDRLEQHGFAFPGRVVRVLATPARAALGDRIAATVQGCEVVRGELDHAYYNGLRFMIDVRSRSGDVVPFIDGGAFDWLVRLANDRKLVLVASGMGAQLVPLLFRAEAQG